MFDDADIKVDTPVGRGSAKLRSPGAGHAVKVAAYGGVLACALCFIAICVAMLLGYDDIVLGPLHIGRSAAQTTESRGQERGKKITDAEQQSTQPKKEEHAVESVKPNEDKQNMDSLAKMREKAVPREKTKVGAPLVIAPQVVENGFVWVIVPMQQGDEDEVDLNNLPKGAFQENGRWFIKVLLKCETLGALPMPIEACSASPKSPGGRPVQKQ